MYARRLIKELWPLIGRISRRAFIIASCVVFSVAALSTVPASAQSASFRSVDTNSDRVLSFDELVAVFGRDGANRLMQSTDHNGDGRITIPELRRGADDDARDNDQRPGSRTDRDDDRDEDRDEDRDGGDDGNDDGGDDGGGDDGGDSGGDGGDSGGDGGDSGGGDD